MNRLAVRVLELRPVRDGVGAARTGARTTRSSTCSPARRIERSPRTNGEVAINLGPVVDRVEEAAGQSAASTSSRTSSAERISPRLRAVPVRRPEVGAGPDGPAAEARDRSADRHAAALRRPRSPSRATGARPAPARRGWARDRDAGDPAARSTSAGPSTSTRSRPRTATRPAGGVRPAAQLPAALRRAPGSSLGIIVAIGAWLAGPSPGRDPAARRWTGAARTASSRPRASPVGSPARAPACGSRCIAIGAARARRLEPPEAADGAGHHDPGARRHRDHRGPGARCRRPRPTPPDRPDGRGSADVGSRRPRRLACPTRSLPFRIDVPEADLVDLRDRLARTRWPEAETVDDWSQGIPLAYVQELCDVLGDEVRLARDRGRAERVPAVPHRARRARHPLPPRALARAGRAPARHHPRLARVGRRVPQGHRAAHRPGRARRRRGRRVPRRVPVAARLRVQRPPDRSRDGRRRASRRRGRR